MIRLERAHHRLGACVRVCLCVRGRKMNKAKDECHQYILCKYSSCDDSLARINFLRRHRQLQQRRNHISNNNNEAALPARMRSGHTQKAREKETFSLYHRLVMMREAKRSIESINMVLTHKKWLLIATIEGGRRMILTY